MDRMQVKAVGGDDTSRGQHANTVTGRPTVSLRSISLQSVFEKGIRNHFVRSNILLWVTVLVVLELVTFAKRLHLPPRHPLPRLSTLFVSSILQISDEPSISTNLPLTNLINLIEDVNTSPQSRACWPACLSRLSYHRTKKLIKL
jgi:hypothetical protein